MKINKTLLLLTFIPSGILISLVGLLGYMHVVKASLLTRDVTAIAAVHPLTGLISSLGAFLWCASATTCFIAATLLKSREPRENYQFFLASAFLSLYLLADDFFLFHEDLASRYFHIGEHAVYGVLGISVLLYSLKFRHVILKTNYLNLLLAMSFLAISVLIDEVTEVLHFGVEVEWEYFLEDGLKWLGIAGWFGYFFETALEHVGAHLHSHHA